MQQFKNNMESGIYKAMRLHYTQEVEYRRFIGIKEVEEEIGCGCSVYEGFKVKRMTIYVLSTQFRNLR